MTDKTAESADGHQQMPQQLQRQQQPSVVRTLSLLDPMIQFLTRATGQTVVPLSSLQGAFPGGRIRLKQLVPCDDVVQLTELGVLQIEATVCSSSPLSSRRSSNEDHQKIEEDKTSIAEKKSNWKTDFRKQWTGEHDTCTGIDPSTNPSWMFKIGFPSGEIDKKLCGSTKTAAKRRMLTLAQRVKEQQKQKGINPGKTAQCDGDNGYNDIDDGDQTISVSEQQQQQQQQRTNKDWNLPRSNSDDRSEALAENPKELDLLQTQKKALDDLSKLLGLSSSEQERSKDTNDRSTTTDFSDLSTHANSKSKLFTSTIPTTILPSQVSYAGSNPAQEADFFEDADETLSFHPAIRQLLKHGTVEGNLYTHQATAIKSALNDDHTIVCTGTGSGKSLCFWIPVLERAIVEGKRSLLIFPTKALAQDQLIKLQSMLQRQEAQELGRHKESDSGDDEPFLLTDHIYAATLDGDTPHPQRSLICSTCNIILTNPDTLHCSILPNWSKQKYYRELLRDLKYVVIDEAHMYEGVFGAHVAMIIARLYRVHNCCQFDALLAADDGQFSDSPSDDLTMSSIVFLACSATLSHPENHLRMLCCIPSWQRVNVVARDTSPRGAKHFFVWNPPLLDEHGKSLGIVKWPKKTRKKDKTKGFQCFNPAVCDGMDTTSTLFGEYDGPIDLSQITQQEEERKNNLRRRDIRRRHSAEETALLLARSVTMGVRCIAFCKTRCLVEWVYDRCIHALKQSPRTEKLVSLVDSYRGGYTRIKRREIEEKLFKNQLLGVVGTSALELGVDIGGVNLTLHCGFPSSHASLMQQAGRAGRGAAASSQPSLAICVCFNSPVDQHLHRHPSSLLSRGTSVQLSMPIYPGLVQGHLLCAGNEFPLAGSLNASAIQSVERAPNNSFLTDHDLFGGRAIYEEALTNLTLQGSMMREDVSTCGGKVSVYKTHPSIKNAWTNVSIRSIENVNYNIVDITHPKQAGRTNGIHDEAAVLDNIPYSRVFYHAFPGAIIVHRGQTYKITSMTRPPPFGNSMRTMTLGAYAKPCNHRYYTRPLSSLKITVVKQMERVDLFTRLSSNQPVVQPDPLALFSSDGADASFGSFAGCGVVTVKRNVHGYKKMSIVTRDEISRSELSLPDMEYDTFAFWIDCDASGIGKGMAHDEFAYGVHALSHAICNVSPLFVPCVLNDVQCDHAVYKPTRVVIFDARAGGSGIVAQLWHHVFKPDGIIQAAIDLLETCLSCSDDRGYSGGCPACIQMGECIKFNDFLCRKSALTIAQHMLGRMQETELYKKNENEFKPSEERDEANSGMCKSVSETATRKRMASKEVMSPRRSKRERAMRVAKDIGSARQRQVVVGRPTWPLDRSDGQPSQQQEE